MNSLDIFFYDVSKTKYMSVQPGDVSKIIKTQESKVKKRESSGSETY